MPKGKIPMRTCVITRNSYPKSELTRIVANKDDIVSIDTTGKMNGRGAYIMLSYDNIQKARKTNVLSKVLKVSIDPSIYDDLESMCNE